MAWRWGAALAAALGACASVPAQALVIETVTVVNRYGYLFGTGGNLPGEQTGGTRETVFAGQRQPGAQSDVGVDYVGEAGEGSFYFLHNNYCVGGCSTASTTVITFTVTNDGDAPVDLRFDSLITPGHLARVNGDAAARGGFDFRVTQFVPGQEDNSLYSAFGNVNDEDLYVSTSTETQFNGETLYDFAEGQVLDWSSTPLNLVLPTLGAGETTQIEYRASYFTTSFGQCADIATCGGIQVVFGDPRNNGSISSFARAAAPAAIGDPVALINREYDPFLIPFAFNPVDSPYPSLPPAQGPVSYDRGYDPLSLGAVPEPATWLTLILGMALVGAALRRDRGRGALAAR